ncbi:protein of unknown function [Amycolatopsis marina]|uniref:DUF4349 domain-containing protein n=1 Tax=Amycolatopsis marina TaxID=490629 RepID=A0A1I0XFU9_9PSEU|nr:DUF4349 domain-containing protein [Amycolatopsis marina]SFA99794.1 protein of unknown function [Amycolatopsis marina]
MRSRWARASAAVLAFGVLAVLVAGCTGQDAGSATDAQANSEYAGQAPVAPEAADSGAGLVPKEAAPNKAAPKDEGAKATVPLGRVSGQDRQLARSARLEIEAPDLGDAVARARTIAGAAGGYTGQERSDLQSATVEVVVPSDELDATLNRLAGLGEVVAREQHTQDVTEQVVDVRSRVETQQASVARVRELLERANSISEITTLESELTSREAELESLKSRQEALAGSVAMSTVTVSIRPAPGPVATDSDTGILGGLAAGWRVFLDVSAGALTVLAAMLPFLVLLGVPVALLVWWLLRKRRTTVATPLPE